MAAFRSKVRDQFDRLVHVECSVSCQQQLDCVDVDLPSKLHDNGHSALVANTATPERAGPSVSTP